MYICRFILRVICLHKNKQDKLTKGLEFLILFGGHDRDLRSGHWDRETLSASSFNPLSRR